MLEEISVIVPSYNTAKYLRRCLLSIMVHPVKEIIVIDDGSHDRSVMIALELCEIDDRLKLISKSENEGRAAARNKGMAAASGEWIAFCDSDDYYLPTRFDQTFRHVDTHTDGVYESINTCYEHPSFQRYFQEQYTGITKSIAPSDLLEQLIQHDGERFSLNGLCVRRSCLSLIGEMDVTLKIAEDTDWIWRAATLCRLIGTDEKNAVAIRWIHDGHQFKHPEMNHYKALFYKKWRNDPAISEKSRAIIKQKYVFFRAAEICGRAPFLAPAIRCMLKL